MKDVPGDARLSALAPTPVALTHMMITLEEKLDLELDAAGAEEAETLKDVADLVTRQLNAMTRRAEEIANKPQRMLEGDPSARLRSRIDLDNTTT